MQKGEMSAKGGSAFGGKNKKHNKKIFFATFLVVLFFGGVFMENVLAAEAGFCSGTTLKTDGRTPYDAVTKNVPVANENDCLYLVQKNKYTKYIFSNISQSDEYLAEIKNWKDVPAGLVTPVTPATPATPATPVVTQTPTKFNYILLESFPGFFTAGTPLTDFPALILAIYKFGIWTVGIAGLFMLVVGGFMYMASAGNTSTAGNARSMIWDALLGIVAALGAYLIMYVINPDLTTLNLSFTTVNVNEPIGKGGGGGNCVPVTKAGSPCTVEQLSVFGENATKASSICKIESGGDQLLASTVDICSDNKPFSIGLFQINMIDSASSICNASGDIFTTGTKKGECLERNANNDCKKWSCAVKDIAKYNACLAKLQDPATNINIAKQMSKNGIFWGPWGANRTCKF